MLLEKYVLYDPVLFTHSLGIFAKSLPHCIWENFHKGEELRHLYQSLKVMNYVEKTTVDLLHRVTYLQENTPPPPPPPYTHTSWDLSKLKHCQVTMERSVRWHFSFYQLFSANMTSEGKTAPGHMQPSWHLMTCSPSTFSHTHKQRSERGTVEQGELKGIWVVWK